MGCMEIEPIGVMRTCFGEKFATPRQPGLCPSAWGRIEFHEPYRSEEFLRGVDGFSHLWILFGFHQTADQAWSPTVRPPRLGGNQRVGVFASRSTFRPNGLGLSLCRFEGMDQSACGPILLLGGVDLVDGTPVYDIKPYLAYAESIPHACSGYAADAPASLEVIITPEAQFDFAALPIRDQAIIKEALSQNPRPAVHHDATRLYGAKICGMNVRFRVDDVVTVHQLEPTTDGEES